MISTESMGKVMRNVEAEITAPRGERDELALLTRRRDPGLGLSLSPAPRERDNDIDPIIIGLLTHLPPSGEVWPEEKRKLWLSLLEGGFKLIYQEAPSAS